MKERLLATARSCGIFSVARRATRRSLRILAYHGLWTTPGYQFGDKLFMPPEQFEARMHWLARSSYPVLGLDEAVDLLARDRLPKAATVITIDDGWSSTFTHMLPVLEALRLPATLYVATNYVIAQHPVAHVAAQYVLQASPLPTVSGDALGLETLVLTEPHRKRTMLSAKQAFSTLANEQARSDALRALAEAAAVDSEPWWSGRQFHYVTPAQIRELYCRGVDIQPHTHNHQMDRTLGRLEDDLRLNRRILADAGVNEAGLRHFCYPSGNWKPGDDERLRALGFRSATLTVSGLNGPGDDLFRLRRFLDGRSVSQAAFEGYLAGLT